MNAYFVASNAFVLLTSFVLARALLPNSRPLLLLVATLAGFPIVVSCTATLLGALSLLSARAALLATGLEAMLALLVTRHQWRSDAPQLRSDSAPIGALELVVAGSLAGLVALRAWNLVTAFLLERTVIAGDDLTYHAPMAAHWLQESRLFLAPANYHAYYPGGAELFAAWFMLPTRIESFAALAGVYWVTLASCSIALICRQAGAGPSAALFGVASLLIAGPVLEQAQSFAAVDLAGAAAVIAATAIVSAMAFPDAPRTLVALAAYAGGLVGLAAGAKVTFAPAAIPLLFWLLRPVWRAPRTVASIAGVFVGAAIACGGYWYLRNWIITGNPVFPANLLWFEGPLNAAARAPTSLLYQLRLLDAADLRGALRQLLQWPLELGYVAVAAYAVTAVALCVPATWRHEPTRRLLLCFVVGLLLLAVIAAAPFSGTHNSPRGNLEIRHRFLLPFVLSGIALAAAWVGRVRLLGPVLAAAGTVAALHLLEYGWIPIAVFGAAGAAAGWLLPRMPALRLSVLREVVVLAALIALPLAANAAIERKRPADERVRRRVVPEWNTLDDLPQGSRIAYFSSFSNVRFFRAFGPRLGRVPVMVQRDGSRHVWMHENWRKRQPTWWKRIKEPRDYARLIDNLRAQRVEYVIVMRAGGHDWPPQRELLRKASFVERIEKQREVEVFQLLPGAP